VWLKTADEILATSLAFAYEPLRPDTMSAIVPPARRDAGSSDGRSPADQEAAAGIGAAASRSDLEVP
jgi:hypothetical protein